MQKKSIGFGFRGWMLILYQAIAYVTFQCFTQYPLNILSDFYGGATVVSKYYSITAMVGIVIQLLLVRPFSRAKNVKLIGTVLGAITLVLAIGVMALPPMPLWYVCYAAINVFSVLYATFTLGILVGQWFPTRKGTVMGIATLAFPIANGLLGPFASSVFAPIGMASAMGQQPVIFGLGGAIGKAFLPFFIVSVIGWLIGIIFVTDYPEQCGAYRDNDKSLTPEIAKAIMMAEIENKRTSVWTFVHTLACAEYWFSTLTIAALLSCSIGLMSQTNAMITAYAELDYTTVMMLIAAFGCIGSYVIGILDTKIGTKKAMIISSVLMIISGILGNIPGPTTLVIALLFVALFMGASSNFGVSCAAQYWRREDFARIFTLSSPIGSAISSAAPMVIAGLLFGATGYKGHGGVFVFVGVCGVIATILMILFNPAHIKKMDDKYRTKAGKELDDALVGRK